MTLFSSVPLALMVVDASGQILEYNARSLALMRPREDDPPLNFLFPLIRFPQADNAHQSLLRAFATASTEGTCELHELEFSGGTNRFFIGDLHIARIDNTNDDEVNFICAIVDQGPLRSSSLTFSTSPSIRTTRSSSTQ